MFITGTDYTPPAPGKVPAAMKKLRCGYETRCAVRASHEYAALVHKGLVDVHPFIDGNGRTARPAYEPCADTSRYGIAIIPPVRRGEYIDVRRLSQRAKRCRQHPFLKSHRRLRDRDAEGLLPSCTNWPVRDTDAREPVKPRPSRKAKGSERCSISYDTWLFWGYGKSRLVDLTKTGLLLI